MKVEVLFFASRFWLNLFFLEDGIAVQEAGRNLLLLQHCR